MRTEAIFFEAPGVVACGEVEIPEPSGDRVLIQTAYSTVSPGTELRSLAGKQAGTKAWPFIPGNSLSGAVVAAGPDSTVKIGAKVYCSGTKAACVELLWGGNAGYAITSSADVYEVPVATSLLDLSFAHIAAIALRGVQLSQVKPGERVAIIGLGLYRPTFGAAFRLGRRGGEGV